MKATNTKCLIDGCECGAPIRNGMCTKHYTRNRRYGDPLREMPTLAERFHSRYDIDQITGCWIWNGAKSSTGYGAIQLGVKNTGKAHRVSWELVNGPINDGLFVCHKCDTPACVNPNHLFLGDSFANMGDMAKKKRSLIGTKNHKAKLSESDVIYIRESNEGRKFLAAKFKVCEMTISRVRTGENWKDVTATKAVYQRMTFS